ncbi:MAG: hypothetical protein PHH44_08270 [bacterium]|nr:hypothetical protein [bacterium]
MIKKMTTATITKTTTAKRTADNDSGDLEDERAGGAGAVSVLAVKLVKVVVLAVGAGETSFVTGLALALFFLTGAGGSCAFFGSILGATGAVLTAGLAAGFFTGGGVSFLPSMVSISSGVKVTTPDLITTLISRLFFSTIVASNIRPFLSRIVSAQDKAFINSINDSINSNDKVFLRYSMFKILLC